jgi:hypothetical protein
LNLFYAMTLICSAQMELNLEPASVWLDGKQHSPKWQRHQDRFYTNVKGKNIELTTKRNAEGSISVRLSEPKTATISFRFQGKSEACRFITEKSRVAFFTIGHPVNFAANALRFPDREKTFVFSGPEVRVYDGLESGAIRTEFDPIHPELKIVETHEQLYKVPENFRPKELENMTLDELRAWTSLQAVTGINMINDSELDSAKKAITHLGSLRDDIRTCDLGQTDDLPEIWVTHIEHQSTQYSVVVVTNLNDRPYSKAFTFGEIGLNPNATYAIFDFWLAKNLGVVAGKLALHVPPKACRTLIIRKFEGKPLLLASSNHVLSEVTCEANATWDSNKRTLSGRSELGLQTSIFIGNWAPEKRFEQASTSNGTLHTHTGFVRLETTGGAWNIKFEKVTTPNTATSVSLDAGPGTPWAVYIGPPRVASKESSGYYLFRNDVLMGYCPNEPFVDEDCEPNTVYSFRTVAFDYAGVPGGIADFTVTTPWVASGSLLARDHDPFAPNKGRYLRNRTIGEQVTIVGGIPRPALSGSPVTSVTYRLSRGYETVSGEIAIDDVSPSQGPATFTLLTDDKVAWTSTIRKGETKTFQVDVSSTYRLTLLLEGDKEVIGDWINPQLTAKPRP